MPTEEKKVTETPEVAETKVPDEDLLKQIEDMKKNMVSRDKYEKVIEERQQLFEKVVNGDPIPEEKAEVVDIEAQIKGLREKLFGGDGTNCKSDLEYAESALKLRKALIEKGEPDPFLPYGHQISPTDQDIAAANRAAEKMAAWVEEAKGNKDVFLAERIRDII